MAVELNMGNEMNNNFRGILSVNHRPYLESKALVERRNNMEMLKCEWNALIRLKVLILSFSLTYDENCWL